MSASTANEQSRPAAIGPHGVDLDKRRGVTRNRVEGKSSILHAELARENAVKTQRGAGR